MPTGCGDSSIACRNRDRMMSRFAVRWLPFATLCAALSGACMDNVQLGPGLEGDGGLDGESAVPWSGLADLFADQDRYTYDFLKAAYGDAVPNTPELQSPGPQIAYSLYNPGDLTVAILGGEVGLILDLGTDDQVASGLGVVET